MNHPRINESLVSKRLEGSESKIATNAAWVDGETLGYHCARLGRCNVPAAAQKLDISGRATLKASAVSPQAQVDRIAATSTETAARAYWRGPFNVVHTCKIRAEHDEWLNIQRRST